VETAEKLGSLGFEISVEDAQAFAHGSMLCRAHFAKALVEKGYAGSVKEAFSKYLSAGGPAYSEKQLLTPAECVRLINAAGGLAFVAHLHTTQLAGERLIGFLEELKEAGLAGIEGFYTEYSAGQQAEFLKLAERLGLAISGGTDFHAEMKPHIAIGRGLGNMSVPDKVLDDIKALRRMA